MNGQSATDIEVEGIVTASHAGQANYGFQVDGNAQWYVIPQLGPGYQTQALKVEMLKQAGKPVKILADPAQPDFVSRRRARNLAHDINDGDDA
jgi:hypothetical protein